MQIRRSYQPAEPPVNLWVPLAKTGYNLPEMKSSARAKTAKPATAPEPLKLVTAPDPETVLARLEAVYGVAEWSPRFGAMDELIACILSQHTSDVNSLRAFDNLKQKYPEWELVIAAPVEEVADTIRSGGLANSKAARINQVLERISSDEGRISLDCLDEMTDADARAYLTALPGVGPKTAAIVLCFALGRPVIPVDTHIFRVAWRLGLIEKKLGEARAHDVLQALIDPAIVYRFHVALINHGRAICKAPRPKCRQCTLTDLCRYFHEQIEIRPTE